MRALGIAGSPRRQGNTEILLDRFLSGAESAGAQVQKIVVSELEIGGCLNCQGCWEDGICVLEDDFGQVNEALVASDVISVASPLFFWNVPAQLKALIDRGQSQWARKFELKKPLPPTPAGHRRRRGVFICVGADPRAYFDGAVWTVRSFFRVYETECWETLLYSEIESKGEIVEHPTAMEEAAHLGRRTVEEEWADRA